MKLFDGLRDKIEEKVVKVAAGRVVQAMPFIPAALAWLTAVPGRKRGLALIFSLLSIGLRHATLFIKDACGAIVVQGYALPDFCSADPGAFAAYVDAAAQFADKYLVTGVDTVTFLLTAWGVWHARYRDRGVNVDSNEQAPGV